MFRIYLLGTMSQGCRLFKWCGNLHVGHYVARVQAFLAESKPTCLALCCDVQAVYAFLKPTCQELCCRGEVCLGGGGTYLLSTVLQGCRLIKRCRNLPAWHCVATCRLFTRF